MVSIEKQFEELEESELRKTLCIGCLVAGFSIKESLYEKKEMIQSKAGNDYLICPNCSVIESEQHKKMPRGEFNSSTKIIRAFEDYKKIKGF